MISIVLPTYNERDVISKTIKDIIKVLPSKTAYEIIVADDDSPDKTRDIVKKDFSNNKHVKVLRRVNKKRGLAPAVIDAFSIAKGDYFLVMDADGQHDQTKISKMISAINHSDIVIGSRFIKGGSVQGWSKKRILVSKFAALMAKPLLSSKVSDPMSGFFMISKKAFLESKKDINPSGYKILLEFLFALPNAKISEVAFKFGLRKQGESKLGGKVIIEYIKMLLVQGLKKYNKFLKFCIVGGIGVVINIGLLYTLTEYIGLFYLASSAIAIEISIISNFILNNFWTWKKSKTGFSKKFLQFNLVSIAALVINLAVLFTLTEIFELWYILSQLAGIVLATLINFYLNDKWTFKK